MKPERDFDANPYSSDEARVARWLVGKTGIGAGDDPIGFLLASHEMLAMQRNNLRRQFIDDCTEMGYSEDEAQGMLDDVETSADADSE